MTSRKNATAFLLLLSILAAIASPALARPVKIWSSKELLEQADLVVLATAVASGDVSIEKPAKDAKPETWVTVLTTFNPASTLKGKALGEQFTVQHVRYLRKEATIAIEDGPSFITFDATGKTTYLLFLKREENGNFTPLSGQYDPQNSVKIVQDYSPPPAADAPKKSSAGEAK